MNSVVDKYNAIVGGIIVMLTAILGEFWFLFVLYLLFQILDWITGWRKAYLKHCESSQIGFAGVFKKLGYWVVIIVAFGCSLAMKALGEKLGISGIALNLSMGIGWFVLASLIVNEARSILENLVEIGYNIPVFLIRGLAITNKLINSKADDIFNSDKQI